MRKKTLFLSFSLLNYYITPNVILFYRIFIESPLSSQHKTTNRWGILAKGHLLTHWFCIWSIAKTTELLISMKRVKYSSKSSKNNSQSGDNKKCNLLKSKRTLLKGNMTSLSSSTIRLLKWSRVVIYYICMFFVDSFYYLSLVKSVTNNANVCLYGFTDWNSKRGGKKETTLLW